MSEQSDRIEATYWDYLLEGKSHLSSVYSFCKKLDITEKEFYDEYASFQAIESAFWESTVRETQATLDADEDYQGYDTRGKLLAFFYTYFEHILKTRSRFLKRFPRRQGALFCPSLKQMKGAFDESAKALLQEVAMEGGTPIPSKITEESYRGGWPVLLYLIEFWLNDTSQGFQDTDSLIEKMVRLGHEVTHFSAVDAAVDLGRFLLGRSAHH